MQQKYSDYKKLIRLREKRGLQFVHAAVVGLAAGLVAVAFQLSLKWTESSLHSLRGYLETNGFPSLLVFALTTSLLGGSSAIITRKLCPEAKGSGIPHIKAVLIHLRQFRWWRILPVKYFAGLLSLGSGFSLGREGPTIQLGSAVGSAVAKFMRVPNKNASHLISCGAGAGLSAAFNAPLAGFIFVIEELRRELSPITYSTALIATVVADSVTRIIVGGSPAFELRNFPAPALSSIWLVAILGLVSGLIGVFFCRVMLQGLERVEELEGPLRKYRAFIIGAFIGVIGYFLPDVFGSGHHTVEHWLHQADKIPPGIFFLLALIATKIGLTVISYCAGVPGGIFAPLLTIGALCGLFIATLGNLFFADTTASLSAFGIIGMAAVLAAVVHAPLTAVVLILEMTANYDLLFPLLVACLISYLVAELFNEKPIYESLLRLNLRTRKGDQLFSDEPLMFQFVVEPGSKMDSLRVANMDLPRGCLLICVRQAHKEIIPSGDTLLQAGDEIEVMISGNVQQAVEKLTVGSKHSV